MLGSFVVIVLNILPNLFGYLKASEKTQGRINLFDNYQPFLQLTRHLIKTISTRTRLDFVLHLTWRRSWRKAGFLAG